MTDPATLDEYNNRFYANSRVDGFGAETTMHSPCPFCAAPGWVSATAIGTEKAMRTGAVCKECGRGAKVIFTHEPGSVSIEFVQTGGSSPPDYLPPIKRIDQ